MSTSMTGGVEGAVGAGPITMSPVSVSFRSGTGGATLSAAGRPRTRGPDQLALPRPGHSAWAHRGAAADCARTHERA